MINSQNILIEKLDGWSNYWRQNRANKVLLLTVASLFGLIIGLVFYLFPLKHRIDSLILEKKHWAVVLSSGLPDQKIEMPSLDTLPMIIELCQNCLVKNRVDITSFNVERFSEKQESNVSVGLDYADLRMHFRGNWQNIENGLNQLERLDKLAIHVQEVILTPEGGEALLRIYIVNI